MACAPSLCSSHCLQASTFSPEAHRTERNRRLISKPGDLALRIVTPDSPLSTGETLAQGCGTPRKTTLACNRRGSGGSLNYRDVPNVLGGHRWDAVEKGAVEGRARPCL